ncbi:hypothetical protein B9G39_17770 [Zooshikella ganghwensis]|uniref:Uncharacterized protein n=1 Tax=Zooshikella ganghwensis TaxID=202772 RepID=A0A4P9VNV0_9GAMM|nr:hypothetical protein B9G39_17770 [Zooshikella ganghwensis]
MVGHELLEFSVGLWSFIWLDVGCGERGVRVASKLYPIRMVFRCGHRVMKPHEPILIGDWGEE